MTPEEFRSQRVAGWMLAVVFFFHLLLLRDAPSLVLVATGILLVGVVQRARQVFVPVWFERIVLLIGVLIVVLSQGRAAAPTLVGEVAGISGAIMLLRPITPAHGLKILFCMLAVLTAGILLRSPVGPVFVVADVVVLMMLAEQIHRPPEASVSFWTSLVRSLRVVIPVSIIVTSIFWFFPELSLPPMVSFTGLGEGSSMDPGTVARLAQSRRVALVATFPEEQQIPKAGDLYWRSRVLETNEGLRWLRAPERRGQMRSLELLPAPKGATVWRYTQESDSSGGAIAVLDRPSIVEATRGEQEVAVLDFGGSMLSAVGIGALKLDVVSVADSVSDTPVKDIDEGCVEVPADVRDNAAVRGVVGKLFVGEQTVNEKLKVMAEYLRTSGFRYSTQPGRFAPSDVAGFLTRKKEGFCEHYAAAAANLLRLDGIPARVVLGYRGGEWNPYLRSITIRDSDAHAWVEAWDEARGAWVRFDPTDFVAPEITERLVSSLNSDKWPWYRHAASFLGAAAEFTRGRFEETLGSLSSEETLDILQPILFGGLVIAGGIWLFRRLRQRQSDRPSHVAFEILDELERQAERKNRARQAGETPLAWFARLAVERPSEADLLNRLATDYEASVYSPGGGEAFISSLRQTVRSLRRKWAENSA